MKIGDIECQPGERVFGYLTVGEKLADIIAPEDGIILNSGRVWPLVARNRFATILGDLVEDGDLSKSPIAHLL